MVFGEPAWTVEDCSPEMLEELDRLQKVRESIPPPGSMAFKERAWPEDCSPEMLGELDRIHKILECPPPKVHTEFCDCEKCVKSGLYDWGINLRQWQKKLDECYEIMREFEALPKSMEEILPAIVPDSQKQDVSDDEENENEIEPATGKQDLSDAEKSLPRDVDSPLENESIVAGDGGGSGGGFLSDSPCRIAPTDFLSSTRVRDSSILAANKEESVNLTSVYENEDIYDSTNTMISNISVTPIPDVTLADSQDGWQSVSTINASETDGEAMSTSSVKPPPGGGTFVIPIKGSAEEGVKDSGVSDVSASPCTNETITVAVNNKTVTLNKSNISQNNVTGTLSEKTDTKTSDYNTTRVLDSSPAPCTSGSDCVKSLVEDNIDNNATRTITEDNITRTLSDNNATRTLIDNNATRTLIDNNATRTMIDNNATRTLIENNITRTLSDNNATRTLIDNNATRTLMDNNATRTLIDNNATRTLTKNNITRTLSDNNATRTSIDNNATRTLTENNIIRTLSDNNTTKTFIDNNATRTLSDNDIAGILSSDNVTRTLIDNNATRTLYEKDVARTLCNNNATRTSIDNNATRTLSDNDIARTSSNNNATDTLYNSIDVLTTIGDCTETNEGNKSHIQQNDTTRRGKNSPRTSLTATNIRTRSKSNLDSDSRANTSRVVDNVMAAVEHAKAIEDDAKTVINNITLRRSRRKKTVRKSEEPILAAKASMEVKPALLPRTLLPDHGADSKTRETLNSQDSSVENGAVPRQSTFRKSNDINSDDVLQLSYSCVGGGDESNTCIGSLNISSSRNLDSEPENLECASGTPPDVTKVATSVVATPYNSTYVSELNDSSFVTPDKRTFLDERAPNQIDQTNVSGFIIPYSSNENNVTVPHVACVTAHNTPLKKDNCGNTPIVQSNNTTPLPNNSKVNTTTSVDTNAFANDSSVQPDESIDVDSSSDISLTVGSSLLSVFDDSDIQPNSTISQVLGQREKSVLVDSSVLPRRSSTCTSLPSGDSNYLEKSRDGRKSMHKHLSTTTIQEQDPAEVSDGTNDASGVNFLSESIADSATPTVGNREDQQTIEPDLLSNSTKTPNNSNVDVGLGESCISSSVMSSLSVTQLLPSPASIEPQDTVPVPDGMDSATNNPTMEDHDASSRNIGHAVAVRKKLASTVYESPLVGYDESVVLTDESSADSSILRRLDEIEDVAQLLGQTGATGNQRLVSELYDTVLPCVSSPNAQPEALLLDETPNRGTKLVSELYDTVLVGVSSQPSTPVISKSSSRQNKLVSTFYESPALDCTVQQQTVKTDEDGGLFTEDECQNTLMAVDGSVQQLTVSSQPSTPVISKSSSRQNKLVSTFYDSPALDCTLQVQQQQQQQQQQQTVKANEDGKLFTENEHHNTHLTVDESVELTTVSSQPSTPAISKSSSRQNKLVATFYDSPALDCTLQVLQQQPQQQQQQQTVKADEDGKLFTEDEYQNTLLTDDASVEHTTDQGADSPSNVDPGESPSLVSPLSPDGEGLDVSATLESAIRETTIHPSAIRDPHFSFPSLEDLEVDVVHGSDSEDENASLLQGVTGTTFVEEKVCEKGDDNDDECSVVTTATNESHDYSMFINPNETAVNLESVKQHISEERKRAEEEESDESDDESGCSDFMNPNQTIIDYNSVKKFKQDALSKEKGVIEEAIEQKELCEGSSDEEDTFQEYINPSQTILDYSSVKQFKRESELKEKEAEALTEPSEEEQTFSEYINPSQTLIDYSSVKKFKHETELKEKEAEALAEPSEEEQTFSEYINPSQTLLDYSSVKKFKQDTLSKEKAVIEEAIEQKELCEGSSDDEDTFQEYINPSQTILDYSSVKQFKRETELKEEEEAEACEEASEEEETFSEYINPSQTLLDYSSVKKHAAAQPCVDEEDPVTCSVVTASGDEDGSLQNVSMFTHQAGTPTIMQTLTSPAISSDVSKVLSDTDTRKSLPESTIHEDAETPSNETNDVNNSTEYPFPGIQITITPASESEKTRKDKSADVLLSSKKDEPSDPKEEVEDSESGEKKRPDSEELDEETKQAEEKEQCVEMEELEREQVAVKEHDMIEDQEEVKEEENKNQEKVIEEESKDQEERSDRDEMGIIENQEVETKENYEVRDACTSPIPEIDIDFQIRSASLIVQKSEPQKEVDLKDDSVELTSPVKEVKEAPSGTARPSDQTVADRTEAKSAAAKKPVKRRARRSRITMPKNWNPPKPRQSAGHDESKRDKTLYTTNVTLRSMSHMPEPTARRSSVTFAQHLQTRVFNTSGKVNSPCYSCSPNVTAESSANASPASLQSILCEGCSSKFKKTEVATGSSSDASRSSMTHAQAKGKKRRQKGNKYVIPCAKGSDDARIEINVKKKRGVQKRKQNKQTGDKKAEGKDSEEQGQTKSAINEGRTNNATDGEDRRISRSRDNKEREEEEEGQQEATRGNRSNISDKSSMANSKQVVESLPKENVEKALVSSKLGKARRVSRETSDEEVVKKSPVKPVKPASQKKDATEGANSTLGNRRKSKDDSEKETEQASDQKNMEEAKETGSRETADSNEKVKEQAEENEENTDKTSSRGVNPKRSTRKIKVASDENADLVPEDGGRRESREKSSDMKGGTRRKSREKSDEEEAAESANIIERKNASKKLSPTTGKRRESKEYETVEKEKQEEALDENDEKQDDEEKKTGSGKRKSTSPGILSCDSVALKKLRSSSTSRSKATKGNRAKRVSLTKRSQTRLLAGRRTVTPTPHRFGVMEGGTPLSTRGNTSRRGGNSSKNLSKEAIAEAVAEAEAKDQPSINITTNTNQKQNTPKLPQEHIESDEKAKSPQDAKAANSSKSKRRPSRSGQSSPDSSASSSKKRRRANSIGNRTNKSGTNKSSTSAKQKNSAPSLRKTRSKDKVLELSHNTDGEVTVIENETFKQTKSRKSREKDPDAENIPPETDTADCARPITKAITPVQKKINRQYQRKVDTSSLMEEIGDEDEGGIPKPFSKNVSLKNESVLRPSTRRSNRSSQQKSIMLMKPPELPVLKKPREISIVNSSNTIISTSMQSDNSAMSSTLKRRKKVLLNPKENNVRTPKLVSGPLNSTVLENRRMSMNTLNTHITNNTSAIGLPNVPDISHIKGTSRPRMSDRQGMSTSTSRGSYDTFAMPPTLTEYLKTFVPKMTTRGRRGKK